MDNSIKRLMREDITIYPFDKMQDSDFVFKDPVVYKGIAIPKTTKVYNRDGELIMTGTAIYLDGVIFDKVSDRDEVYTRFTGRVPIQKLLLYPGLKGNVELVELLI